MTEIDPLEPRIVVPDVTFVPPTNRQAQGSASRGLASRLAPGQPVPVYLAAAMLLLVAAFAGASAIFATIFGDSPHPVGTAVVPILVMCHFAYRPRHRWWAALAAVFVVVTGAVLCSGLRPNAYLLDCVAAIGIPVYTLVTRLPKR